jgi:GNAT superfamily N-acetyltransferase
LTLAPRRTIISGLHIEYQELAKHDLTPGRIQEIESLLRQLPAGPSVISEEWLTSLLDNGTRLLGAFHNDRLVGVTLLALALFETANRAWIQDIVEDAAYRGLGIITELLKMAETLSQSVGAESINLTASIDEVDVRRQCEELGYHCVVTIAFQKKL